jgi:hypothetical protein
MSFLMIGIEPLIRGVWYIFQLAIQTKDHNLYLK